MKHAASWRKIFAVATTVARALVLSSCSTAASVEAPPPLALAPEEHAPALPPLPPSVVDAPISFSLHNAVRALEDAVPQRFGDLNKRIANPSNRRQKFAFEAIRSPFRVSINGQRLTLSTVVEYAGRGWYDPPLAPEVSASCGTDGVRPRIRVALTSDLSLGNDWKLKTRTRLARAEPYSEEKRDECRVTVFSVDVTPRVISAVDALLRKELRTVDRRLAALDIKRPLEHWYNLLNRPVHIADSLWLNFNPGEVHFGGLRADDSTIVADIRLFALPVITAGERPDDRKVPLPPFRHAELDVGDSLRVLVDGRLGYDVASTFLQRALSGRRFSRFGRSVKVDSAGMYGLGDGRVVVALIFSGALNGRVYLVGTPQIERSTHTLTVPDLSFDVATDNALAQGVAWFKRDEVIQELRKRASIPLTGTVDNVREKVEDAMNRELTDGVSLGAELTGGRLIDVQATERELLVRSEISGTLRLAIDRKLPGSKVRAAGRNTK